jgi:hypothetical protein
LALVVDFEPKDPWFKPQAAQKTKKKKVFFFQNDPFPLPKFLRIDQNCTEIFTVCSVERNPELLCTLEKTSFGEE